MLPGLHARIARATGPLGLQRQVSVDEVCPPSNRESGSLVFIIFRGLGSFLFADINFLLFDSSSKLLQMNHNQ